MKGALARGRMNLPRSKSIEKNTTLRPNLFSALMRLRLPDRPLVIWVDAMCISMEDLAERSA